MHRKASYMQTIRDHILHRNLWSFIPFPVISSLQKSSSYLMPVEFPAGTEHFMSRDLSHVRIQTDRSVSKNLEFVLKATGWKKKSEIKERIDNVLRQVGMQDKGYKMPHELSGGEQQRIVIARALLNNPKLILADEPTGNLDPETSGQIVQLLHDICQQGTAVIMTTHNYTIVHNYPARIVKCENACLSDVRE